MKKIIISVTNDVATDQRVNRIATTLHNAGVRVKIIGVYRKKMHEFSKFPYSVKLLKCPIQKGFFFYANYNFFLFFRLLFEKTDALLANDLDSLPANYFVSIIRKKTLIYDSHELFTEVPELVHRPKVKMVWFKIEKYILPKLKHCYTVCDSIAQYYTKLYNVPFNVVRNVPFRKEIPVEPLKIPEFSGKKIIMYQGALNLGRGIEDVIQAMKYLDGVVLIIAGNGTIEKELKDLVNKENLGLKVHFTGNLLPYELHKYTCIADAGFSLEHHLGMSYYFALPNKLFDYIQAEVPVLVSNLPEMAAIVKNYNIGEIATTHEPEKLASLFKDVIFNNEKRALWKENLKKAAKELCWENEKTILLDIYKNAGIL